MRTFLVSLRLPAAGPAALTVAGERARSAVEDLAREGVTVRWIRSVYVAEDDTCLLVFEAPSPEAVGEASRRAALEYERIVEAGGQPR
jgi:Nickel responsive protein SCO4226-like